MLAARRRITRNGEMFSPRFVVVREASIPAAKLKRVGQHIKHTLLAKLLNDGLIAILFQTETVEILIDSIVDCIFAIFVFTQRYTVKVKLADALRIRGGFGINWCH